MQDLKVIIKKTKKGHTTTIKSSNGNVMFSGTGQNRKASAKKTFKSLVKHLELGMYNIIEE